MTAIHPRRTKMPPGRAGRLVLATTVGHGTLDARIATLTQLRQTMGLCSIALFEDGTLAGTERVRLARECGDPIIFGPVTGRFPDFPDCADWTLLLSALDQRRNAYWVIVGDGVSEWALPALAQAIAGNRSFAIADDRELSPTLAAHIEALVEGGFAYIAASPQLLGFAASSDGISLAGAVLTRLETALGKQARAADMAHILPGFFLAREPNPLVLPSALIPVHSPGRI